MKKIRGKQIGGWVMNDFTSLIFGTLLFLGGAVVEDVPVVHLVEDVLVVEEVGAVEVIDHPVLDFVAVHVVEDVLNVQLRDDVVVAVRVDERPDEGGNFPSVSNFADEVAGVDRERDVHLSSYLQAGNHSRLLWMYLTIVQIRCQAFIG